jgi:hypothetical protein
VFPQSQDDTGECTSTSESPETAPVNSNEEKEIQAQPAPSVGSGDTIWVEGLVPGIDFCNHDLKPVATWEVDGIGSVSRVPFSMYLLSGWPNICLCYLSAFYNFSIKQYRTFFFLSSF